jgi:hypothetical protein
VFNNEKTQSPKISALYPFWEIKLGYLGLGSTLTSSMCGLFISPSFLFVDFAIFILYYTITLWTIIKVVRLLFIGTLPSQSLQIHTNSYRLEQSRSHRILWLLEELQLKYELKTFKRRADKLAPAELKEVHPLGKSPLITIQAPGAEKPLVLAESGAIVEYLCDHFSSARPTLVPQRYAPGNEGKVGGETEEWMRYRYFMHYVEGSLMPFLVMTLVNDCKSTFL